MSIIVPAVLMALAGAMHCVAMCGGLALIVSRSGGVSSTGAVVAGADDNGPRADTSIHPGQNGSGSRGQGRRRTQSWLTARFVVYGLGKAFTYGTLGLLVGLIGVVTASLRGGQQILSIAAGIVLILVGVHLAGVSWLSRLAAPVGSSHLIGWMASRLSGSGKGPAFALGILNGLLPCGLVYGALAAALAQGTPVESTLFMIVFGIGTMPALWLSVRLAAWVSIQTRLQLSRLSGVLLVLYGGFMLLRGTDIMQQLTQLL